MTSQASDEIQQEHTRVVVLAVDRSKQAEHAFNWYKTYAHKPENHVIMVHVPEGATIHSSKGLNLPEGEWQKMAATEKATTDELHMKYKKKIDEAGLNAEFKTIYGKPGEVIVEVAKQFNANVVVIGTRGMGSIRRTILGSVSDYVIHHAHVPVIVCRQ